jgi:hypothetical protein
MNQPYLIAVIVFAIFIWLRLYAALRRSSAPGQRSPPRRRQSSNSRPPPVLPANRVPFSQNPSSSQEIHMNPISALIFVIFLGGAALTFVARMPMPVTIALAVVGVFLGYSVKMAQQWERAVVLRLGKLQAVKGPGLFILVPIIDQVTVWIDQRIRTSEFSAEQALTRDTVPVNVDAIVIWMVPDPARAALHSAAYNSAAQRVAQTS